ncbi:MAG: hypothetical protein RQ826_03085 [Xanthomonadales bacterium]|nr:hypothetical protein [Xanthomonadales bacterium]
MKKRRDEPEAFSISFLDVITCGFGAIILLLMIAKTGTSEVLEAVPTYLTGMVRDLQTQLFEIRGEARVLNRELTAKQEQVSEWKERVARLQAELGSTRKRSEALQQDASVNTIISGELELAVQRMSEDMKRLAAQDRSVDSTLVGGIPVDSEYIIFIIDTSGSMQQLNWNRMIQTLTTTLDIYPQVKGLQIMSDMGDYMFSQYRRKWVPDTPGRRRAIVNLMRNWAPFSNSSPVEGITEAIRHFYDPNKKISIYVFGDDFTGSSISTVVDTVNRLNPKDENGRPQIRIHAVGFPMPANAPVRAQQANRRFAALMREISRQNEGTLVGLN